MNRYRENKSLTGTPRYASLNNHLGMEQSRRDDLESLGYVFIYFLWGKLPWQGLRAETKEEKYSRIMECKLEVGFERLCQGFPDEFLTYFDYCHSLGFNETPDYSYLRNLFAEVMSRRNIEDDGVYDWMDDSLSHTISALPKHCVNVGGLIRQDLLKPAPKTLRESMILDESVRHQLSHTNRLDVRKNVSSYENNTGPTDVLNQSGSLSPGHSYPTPQFTSEGDLNSARPQIDEMSRARTMSNIKGVTAEDDTEGEKKEKKKFKWFVVNR